MKEIDLCVTWNWKFDTGFIRILEQISLEKQYRFNNVIPENLGEFLQMCEQGEYQIFGFLDRASDTDTGFESLATWALRNVRRFFNHPKTASRASDKAAMHYELINAGLQTPYTIILPPFDIQPSLPPLDLSPLGGNFAIKPAHGGGSEGVVLPAYHGDEVQAARQQFPTDSYLLQQSIKPQVIDGSPAWFRIIFCCGLIFPFWWNTQTHIYSPVTGIQSDRFNLSALRTIPRNIADFIKLDLFSTEIAVTPEGKFTVVDYINDPIDLRKQSEAPDGVPDDILHQIAERLLTQCATLRDSQPHDHFK